ncbi:2-dehydro-3-deoxygalactonokinase [Colwellia sp. 1_MG-2023]|uniref:2-dehydro-3-deoxygalactonokinase n=1 Tax=unclassified Colwellia TaxID=196834 RepID=UPI001C09D8E3|nr:MULTISPECIES: 2-dehydro-3-deoxygalactonokinase [unclassified Colwellia]MBU2924840.1 2-dehydro-3-deoxygalactonokinase [Colwellia sp. C2M11]MDO6654074.1 2-dehydro-3-deoxygalactonokinase [Colwellia sp. 3_MG-2023]MDO6665492.1 2-dehydro-3-deoxygalactonokinase [Colwellia sp. 2_MG-2023]MDO6689749.1 2-dehydro-3-deoxygalactonokinase [Colwellia sp. 1_MG-2023]
MKRTKLSAGYLIVDWGTTNFRVFHMSNDDKLLKKQELPLGLLHITDGNFAKALENVLADWLRSYKKLPILMAGMVGSVTGWFNVDYVETNASKAKLIATAHSFTLPWGAPATIIPGVNHKNNEGSFDVMRGEEVQVFGLAKLVNKSLFNAVLPGTHSKHVRVVNSEISELSSFMTGELFSILSEHSILGKGLPKQEKDKNTFILGVKAGQTNRLMNTLFTVRTHQLFNKVNRAHVKEYLSGLLIGNELKNLSFSHTFLVGGSELCDNYKVACDILSIESTYYSGDDCFLAGMIELNKVINNA